MKPETNSHSVALSSRTHGELVRHLIRADGQEDLCFALWHPSQGKTRKSALIYRSILPHEGERRVHGNASFLPRYFERAVAEAAAENAGLAFLHSHPSRGWQNETLQNKPHLPTLRSERLSLRGV
jgi:molybdopterin-synthase adenylyltransferase